MKTDNTICENNWVVLQGTDGRKTLGFVAKGSSARIGKRKRKLDALIGRAWGQIFAVRSDDVLEPISEESHLNEALMPDLNTKRNNQFLQDDTANQRLNQEAILELKEQGLQGEELVQTVAKNSATFKNKTAFSQQKYLKRKRAKFDIKVRVIKPTALTLCSTYFERSPEKTLNLRPDALAMLLGYGGIRAGARVLLYENCTGLITGAIAERLGGHGRIINVFVGATPPATEIIRMLCLGSARMKTIVHTPIELFSSIKKDEPEDDEPLRYVIREGAEIPRTQTEYQPSARRAETIALRCKRGIVKQWITDRCDCLVVATRYDVVKVFDMLLQYVAPSGCFAAYCMHLQDAADLQYALQLSKMAIRVELTEVALVNHQVLPGRSHPAMTDSATGGYVVTGIRIAYDPGEEGNGQKSGSVSN